MKVAATAANKQTQSRAVANNVSEQKNTSRGDSESAEFVDNRPETKALKSLQMMINSSPRMAAQRQRMANIFGNTNNVIKGPDENVQNNTSDKVFQRKVVVTSKFGGFNKKDFTLLSHINWAKAASNGPVSDLDSDKDWSGTKKDEFVHLVEHGGKGTITGASPDDIANAANTLPKNYANQVRITSCWSGVPPNINDSLIAQVKNKMDKDHKHIVVVGVTGPSITNEEANSGGMEVVKPSELGTASFIQDALLGTLTDKTDIKDARSIGIWKKYAGMKSAWELDIGKKPYSTMSIEDLANEAAVKSKDFYNDFINLLRINGCLQDAKDQLVGA